jgi:hypothetical protein
MLKNIRSVKKASYLSVRLCKMGVYVGVSGFMDFLF